MILSQEMQIGCRHSFPEAASLSAPALLPKLPPKNYGGSEILPNLQTKMFAQMFSWILFENIRLVSQR